MTFGEVFAAFANANQGARRTREEAYIFWKSVPTEEPVCSGLKALVREDLKREWYNSRDSVFRMNTKEQWHANIDHLNMVLEDSAGRISLKNLHCIYNKPTSLYWMQSAQRTSNTGQRDRYPAILFPATYETWNDCYENRPNIEHTHFLANSVRITETGPSTLQSVINAHLSICNQAANYLHQVKSKALKLHSGAFSFGPRAAFSSRQREAFVDEYQHYHLFPLVRAIVIIVDRVEDGLYDLPRDSDGMISLAGAARCQTVLIARTGLEHGLSAPVSLESLRPKSLPVKRIDHMGDIDLVGVPLNVAVQFIVDLEKRENLADPDRKDLEFHSNSEKQAEAWADQTLAKAEAQGYDKVYETSTSVRRVKASLVGEYDGSHDSHSLGMQWKYP
ncbi:hypothetical protein MMC10_004542 [Thelotrema lepadinum]|nr:hypothetical protein [Thelotrema lepadinum]